MQYWTEEFRDKNQDSSNLLRGEETVRDASNNTCQHTKKLISMADQNKGKFHKEPKLQPHN